MKTKRIVMGLLAFTIAIGSSFASLTPAQNAWIKISLLGTNYFLCVDSGFQCNDSGPVTCNIEVATISGLVSVSAKRPLSCGTVLHSNTGVPVGLYFPLFGLIQYAE